MNSFLRYSILAAAAIAALAAGAWFANLNRGAAAIETATVYSSPRPFPALTLTDQNGEPFDASRLEGQWSWLFFGFVHCPDVCPATLTLLKQARATLPADEAPEVVLVSVDPERDTPELLARYVGYFDPSFTGVTGDPETIDALTRSLYVSHQKVPLDNGGYTVDHSAAIFIVDPQARVVAVSTPPHGVRALAADYAAIRGL